MRQVLGGMKAAPFVGHVVGVNSAVGGGKMLLEYGVRGTCGTRSFCVGVAAAAAADAALAAAFGARRAQPQVCIVAVAAVWAAASRQTQTGIRSRHRVVAQVRRLAVRIEVVTRRWEKWRRSGLVLREDQRGRRRRGHRQHPAAADAAVGAAAAPAHAALLALRPAFGQQLLLGVAVGQSSDARVRLPLRGAFLRLDAAGGHAVALHEPRVPLVLRNHASLGTGAQLVSHGALRLSASFRMIVLTLVAVSALLSWSGEMNRFIYKRNINK